MFRKFGWMREGQCGLGEIDPSDSIGFGRGTILHPKYTIMSVFGRKEAKIPQNMPYDVYMGQ